MLSSSEGIILECIIHMVLNMSFTKVCGNVIFVFCLCLSIMMFIELPLNFLLISTFFSYKKKKAEQYLDCFCNLVYNQLLKFLNKRQAPLSTFPPSPL